MIKYVPNALSLFRLISPVFLYYFISHGLNWHFVFLFAIAALSDFFDGYVARKFAVTSNIGAIIDPLADKILVGATFIIFYSVEAMHFFTLLIVLARDIGILSFIAYMYIKKIKLTFSPLYSSKVNTVIQLVFISNLAIGLLSKHSCGFICEIIVVISTVFSGIDYLLRKEQFIQNA